MRARSVSEVTRHIKDLIEGDPELDNLWIEGEVSNFRRAASGHCYFTLKDSESELPCVMWRTVAATLTWIPSQGDLVDAHGYVSVYERGGAYQFYADALEPGGVGLLWQEFARLKGRLEAEGLFAEERKRPLPRWSARIGVVTSASGAALRDILHVLEARYPLAQVVLSPTLVQGRDAPLCIVEALRRLDDEPDIDVVIVARGGGSLEDLWAFNDEGVARAIAASRAPVISGVGHETDLTIADLVADHRAPTPSAAAAAAVPDATALRLQVQDHIGTLVTLIRGRIAELAERLAQRERLLRLYQPVRLIAEKRLRLDELLEQMHRQLQHRIRLRASGLSGKAARLASLDPAHVIRRGYAIVEHRETGLRLSSVLQISPSDPVRIHLQDGQVDAEVSETHAAESANSGKERREGVWTSTRSGL